LTQRLTWLGFTLPLLIKDCHGGSLANHHKIFQMDSIDDDDDFGYLYADVEAQATSATAPEPNIASDSTTNKLCLEADASTDTEDDDDDDDFNIVLNDDDTRKVRNGTGYEEHNEEDGENDNDDRSREKLEHLRPIKVALFQSRASDWEENVCNQCNRSHSSHVAKIRAATNSVVPQCGYGYGFSHPWSRNILDINIDTFQEKPWRYPGVDITDYFNFGFNEDTWKEYCNRLEQFRQRKYVQTRIPIYDSSEFNQAYGAGFEHNKVFKETSAGDTTEFKPLSIFANGGRRPLELPKGRAIEVEGSVSERQPSIDVKRARIQDPDVVIQIAVQDSTEGYYGSGKDELGHTDCSVHETSKIGDLCMDEKDKDTGIICSGGSSGDEPSVGSLEGSLDAPFSLRRCTQPRIPSNLMSVDSSSHGRDRISDVDEYHHPKVTVCASEGIDELETGNEAKEGVGGNLCNSDVCMIETELSNGDPSHFSPTLSCCGSDSKASADSVCGDPVKMHSQLDLGTEMHESFTSDHKNSNSNGIETKPGRIKYSSRHRCPIWEEQKHHYGRAHSVAEKRFHPKSDHNGFCVIDVEGDRKHYSRRRSAVQYGLKRSSHFTEQKRHYKRCNDASPMLDATRWYERNHSSRDCSRHNERWDDFGCHDQHDFPYHRGTGLSCGNGSERFANSHVRAVHTKYPHGKSHLSLRDAFGPHVRQKRNERENHHRSSRVEEDEIDRDGKHCGWRLSSQDMIPLTYRESTRLVSNCSSVFQKGNTWERKMKNLQYMKRAHFDSQLLDYKHEDDFVQKTCGRSVSYTDRDTDFLDEIYDRPLPLVGREVKLFGRRERYGGISHLDMDCSLSAGFKGEHHSQTDLRYSPSWSCRELYKINEVRLHDNIPPRNNVYESRSTEKYGRRWRKLYGEEGGDSGWFGSFNGIDKTDDAIDYHYYDQVHLGRGRYGLRGKAVYLMKDETRDQYAEEALFFKEKTSMDERIHSKYEPAHCGMGIRDMKSEHHRREMLRERLGASCLDGDTNVIYTSENEQTTLRCRDSVDLNVGEGKAKMGSLRNLQSSGRCSHGRSLVHDGRLHKRELRFAKEQTPLHGFNESGRGKAVQTDIPIGESNEEDEMWLDKFPSTEHNENLDIEEGQIITDEPTIEDYLEKKPVSESAVLPQIVKKRILHDEKNASIGTKVVEEFDNQRILETLAKMEKRRERFKDLSTLKKEAGKTATSLVDTDETMQRRPARKRQWGGI
ncbi:Fip1 domain-containing protein, partial [Cephalotus follicularis]